MAKLINSNLTSSILKALGIFGGVQVVNILCSIVRTKLIAIWIGSVGVGLFGIYNSAIELLNSIFQLGIRNSAVRDIANNGQASHTIIVVRRWAIALGLIGLIVTIILSPALSNFTFGDNKHTTSFFIIAIIILLSSIQSGELAILQGLQQLRRLARASMWGILVGVALSAPMFFYWGIDSVLPALIIYSLATTIATLSQRVNLDKPVPTITIKETIKKGQGFITLGIYLTVSAIVTTLVAYLFMTYLNKTGDTNTVGLYQAGFTMVNKYVGLIFTAIAMEYYPRLSKVVTSPKRVSIFVSHEMAIALWILIPIIAIFIASNELLITILYSSDFLVINSFIVWAIIGTIFRAISWCIAFVILARGDGKIYLLTESLSAITSITLNIIAYNYWGLTGLGLAYLLWYIAYTLIVASVYKFKYHLSLGRKMHRLILFAIVTATACAIGYSFTGWYIPAIIALLTIPLSISRLLRKRFDKIKPQASSSH